MKGVPIKFRGKTFKGKVVFGKCLTYTHAAEGEEKFLWIGDEDNGYHNIDEETLAQLVGYDADGVEIYEGDTVDGSFCYEPFKAVLFVNANLKFYRKVERNDG